ncbi:DUF550 domain-containing protein [Klebsiella quasipneumoniae subsp. quasipneumoniae]|nr:DUF550 domain-containing protein [Klebsiella quasipneumoniae]MCW9321867.1 DUF550 domain-containing protein [Klebsiella quasipneumoniae]MCW9335176.1 DUF550 domain-containing protein [Klebsiella quasipneumoniae]
MTKSTITRERIQRIIRAINSEAYDEEEIREWLSSDEIMELSRMALAAMDSEPVAYIFKHPAGRLFWSLTDESNKGHDDVMPVYAAPQPAPERDQVRIAHAEWSQATFGNVGPVGPLKHLSKEALEAATEPGDLSEWADMQFLLWDAQRRAGITDEQITKAMIEKLEVNKQREWPEPKDGEPRLHIKEQPAPVVPDEKDKTVDADDHPLLWSFNEGWNACRAAMLKAQPQNAPQNIPEIIPDCWCRTCRPLVFNDMRFVVCPDCGNKRCPRANDHRNACTGSNEPGQEGSAYPAAPQEVPDGK